MQPECQVTSVGDGLGVRCGLDKRRAREQEGRGGWTVEVTGLSLSWFCPEVVSTSPPWDAISVFFNEGAEKVLRGFLLFEIFLPLKNQTPRTHKCLQITGSEGERQGGRKGKAEGGTGA